MRRADWWDAPNMRHTKRFAFYLARDLGQRGCRHHRTQDRLPAGSLPALTFSLSVALASLALPHGASAQTMALAPRPTQVRVKSTLWPFTGRPTRVRADACPVTWRVVAVAPESAWASALTYSLRETVPSRCVLRPLILSWTDLAPSYALPAQDTQSTERYIFVGQASTLAPRIPALRTYVLGLAEKPPGIRGLPTEHVTVMPLPAVGYAAGMATAAWLTQESADPDHTAVPAHFAPKRAHRRPTSARGRQVVQLALPLPPDPASQALLSGFAAGLRREAPGRMAVLVQGERETPVAIHAVARIDPDRPAALITVTRPDVGRLACGVDLKAMAQAWSHPAPGAPVSIEASRDLWTCTWTAFSRGQAAVPEGGSPSQGTKAQGVTAVVEGALSRAASDLATPGKDQPGWVTDYTRPPIAIPVGEWPTAPGPEARP